MIPIHNHRLEPTEADIRVDDPRVVSGRLTGPRCRYASTIEIAYPFRPIPGGGLKAVIPEPSFWDPQAPLVYEALLTLADGSTVKQLHGLRTLHLSPAGLRVNRRPFRIAGVERSSLTDADALRAAGVDTLLVPVSPETESLWSPADSLGFFLIGIVGDADRAARLSGHASALAWLLPPSAHIPDSLRHAGTLLGVLSDSPTESPWAQFVAGRRRVDARPWLAMGTRADDAIGGVLG